MLFGAHVSIAGGVFNAPANAAKIGCEVFQIFTRSPQGGPAPKLTNDIVKQFKDELKVHAQARFYVHAPYYLNLANPNRQIRSNTARIVREDLERASLLGAEALMFHIGSAKETTQEQAEAWVIEGLDKIMDGYTGSTQLLIENSAGAGMVMGDEFEEIARFLKGARAGSAIGVCLDTQHAFASGYDLCSHSATDRLLNAYKKIIGLDTLKLIHANDSKTELGSHKDRHEHLGRGKIGLTGFKALVSHPAMKDIDMILETPYNDDYGVEEDLKTLKQLRG
ncbi:MAG: deoxyribonuclease IV [Candidatus Uhrbacteria bacterium]|nr:deoxyribonuclease IV [Patescibacteria group bacterium]MBU1907342.1 deoxyribonuclease IV [Patescibacteria group bacterium]